MNSLEKLVLLSEVDKSYIAGFINGEGCISITKRTDKEYLCGHSFISNLRVVNTNLSILEWLKNKTGVGVILKSNIILPRCKDRYEWKVATLQAVNVCRTILPFLKIKNRQVEILIEFQKLKDENKQNGTRGVPPERWQKQEILRNEIHLLNKKGK